MARPFRCMPGPRGLPLLGNVLDYSCIGRYTFDRMYLAKLENRDVYGKIYQEKLGPARIVQVFDPDDAGRVFRSDSRYPRRPALPITLTAHARDGMALGLGSLNGTEWYALRHAVQSLMMRRNAATVYLPAQSHVAEDFLSTLDHVTEGTGGRVTDLNNLIMRYAMESIGVVCFNERLGVLNGDQVSPHSGDHMLKATADMFEAVQKTTFAFPWYALYRTPLYQQFVKGRSLCNRIGEKYLETELKQYSNNHQQRNKSTKDAESMNRESLVESGVAIEPPSECIGKHMARNLASDCMKGKTADEPPSFLRSLLDTGATLSNQQIIGLTTDLFTAGIDSTANALTFVIYNLARNTHAQERLAAEILQVAPPGAPVTSQTIDNLHYLKACVKESFRLNFPVEGGTIRILDKDLVLGGYHVPKDTIVAFNNQTMCLQEEYFDDPGQYLPERWLKTGSATTRPPPNFVMLPFGYGPRMCIGRRFAEQEIYLAIIKILQKYHIRHEETEKLGMINRVFTMPDRPLNVTLTSRT